MPRPGLRTRTKKRVKKRVPGGRLKTFYKKKKPGTVKCAVCKKSLRGIPKLEKTKLKKLPKSQRKVSRVYGGYLCHKCLKEKILSGIKQKFK